MKDTTLLQWTHAGGMFQFSRQHRQNAAYIPPLQPTPCAALQSLDVAHGTDTYEQSHLAPLIHYWISV